MPTVERTVQVNSVWTAKVDHIWSVMNGRNAKSKGHLFTFPFAMTDNSLKECGKRSFKMSINDDNFDADDSNFASVKNYDPIVVTTASVQSFTPGMETDEDAINLCLQWYVLLV